MSKKIVISKSGYNALTETDSNNLIYSSDYDSLKYHSSGTVDVAVSGANAEGSVTHSLGYIPFFVVYVNRFSGASALRFNMCPGTFSSMFGTTIASAYADSTKLYFRVETSSATATYNFYYKIFRNRVNI